MTSTFNFDIQAFILVILEDTTSPFFPKRISFNNPAEKSEQIHFLTNKQNMGPIKCILQP
jgi:hypothetical protein